MTRPAANRFAGTNTFHLIPYSDIPHHRRKEIIYTKEVCKIERGKMTTIIPGSQSGET
jgi:hypothetical protein